MRFLIQTSNEAKSDIQKQKIVGDKIVLKEIDIFLNQIKLNIKNGVCKNGAIRYKIKISGLEGLHKNIDSL